GCAPRGPRGRDARPRGDTVSLLLLDGTALNGQPLATYNARRDAYRRALRSDPCAYCATASKNLHTIDHIEPPSRPDDPLPTTNWYNLTGACEPCNAAKGN